MWAWSMPCTRTVLNLECPSNSTRDSAFAGRCWTRYANLTLRPGRFGVGSVELHRSDNVCKSAGLSRQPEVIPREPHFGMLAIQRKVSKARNKRLIGEQVSILVEGRSKETDLLWEGRMPTQAPEIDGVTLINDYEGAEPRTGEIRRLLITEAHDYDVVGTLLPPTEKRVSDLVSIHAGV